MIARFDPAIQRVVQQARTKLRKRLPAAVELVYDNYNALAIGFASSERTSDAVFSIAVFPRWVSLFFLQTGAHLTDPKGLLKGSGNQIRHIRLTAAADIDSPDVRGLMKEALALAEVRVARSGKGRMVIKSVSAKQRPRRPRET